MRPFVFTTLVGAVAHNLNRGADSVKLFEIGHAFRRAADGRLEETRGVALAAAGRARPLDWSRPSEALDFFDVKGHVEELLATAGVGPVAFVPGARPYLHPGRQAEIDAGGPAIGFIGELHPGLAAGRDLDERVFVAELRLEALTLAPTPLRVEPVPREPAVERDLALVVPAEHPGERIVAAVREAALEDLVAVEVFDRYEGAQVPEGHYSLGLRLTFQADRTLTVEAIDERMGRLVDRLEKEHGYRLR